MCPLLSATMSLWSPYEVQTEVDVFVSLVDVEVLSSSQVNGTFIEIPLKIFLGPIVQYFLDQINQEIISYTSLRHDLKHKVSFNN